MYHDFALDFYCVASHCCFWFRQLWIGLCGTKAKMNRTTRNSKWEMIHSFLLTECVERNLIAYTTTSKTHFLLVTAILLRDFLTTQFLCDNIICTMYRCQKIKSVFQSTKHVPLISDGDFCVTTQVYHHLLTWQVLTLNKMLGGTTLKTSNLKCQLQSSVLYITPVHLQCHLLC